MNPKISVLVPVYKVEPYLQRCIDSVLAQDFQDWEMILVDDGSPDHCPEICDEAARRDERIIVVHKENGGLPSARLAGFERARGDYLVFLDSDDWLLEGALTTLYGEITSGDYDTVRSRPMRYDEKGKNWGETYEINCGEVIDSEKYTLLLLHNRIAPYLHSAIYKRSLFTKEIFNQVVTGGISIGEDWVTNMLISSSVHKYKAIEKSTYAYFCNSESMMSTCILSPLYNIMVDNVLNAFYEKSSNAVKRGHCVKIIVSLINAHFVYEIPYHKEWYLKIRAFITHNENYDEINKYIPHQYLRFINNRLLFFMYSRLFAFSKFVIKQKMQRRIVIPKE